MALNINPIDTGALRALAGNTVPRYDLPLHAITGGDFFTNMANQNNKNRELNTQQENSDTEKAKIPILQQQANNQTTIANSDAARIPIEQQNANTSASLKDLQGQELKLKGQALQADIQQRQADKDMADKQQGLAAGIVGMAQIQNDTTLSPSDKMAKMEQAKKTLLDTAYTQGHITKDEYTQELAMPAQAVQQHMQAEFTANHIAQQEKDKPGSSSFDPMNPLASQGAKGKPTSAQTNANQLAILQTAVDTAASPEDRTTAQTNLDNFKAAGHIQSTNDKINTQTTPAFLKNVDKEADAAQQDQINNVVLQNTIKDPNFVSGLAANSETMVKRGLAAASAAVGIPYDPKTSPNEVMNDVSTRAQLDFFKLLGQRGNSLEWQAAGKAVAHPTNTMQGLQGLAAITDFNNEAKIQFSQFAHMYQENNNGSISGMQNAWSNYLGSLGNPTDPKTGLFIGGQKLRSADYTQYATDPKYKQKNVVPMSSGGSFSPNPVQSSGQQPSSKVLNYNPSTGKLE